MNQTSTLLRAMDRDAPENGPPFHFNVPLEYRHSNDFYLQDNLNGTATLTALRTFDRERQKEFFIPVIMSDSGHPAKTVTSTLTVTIGDQNDHGHVAGEKTIFINSHRGEMSFYQERSSFFLIADKIFANYHSVDFRLLMLFKNSPKGHLLFITNCDSIVGANFYLTQFLLKTDSISAPNICSLC